MEEAFKQYNAPQKHIKTFLFKLNEKAWPKCYLKSVHFTKIGCVASAIQLNKLIIKNRLK